MAIAFGTPITLPDGRSGVVIPSAYRLCGRVRVKVQGGRKVWLSEDDCVPTYDLKLGQMLTHQNSV